MKKIYVAFIVFGSVLMVAFTNGFDKVAKPTSEVVEASIYKPVIVLELFTSQGCSSCPSADLLLQEVKNEFVEEVFALSYHVDYWNYIGWKDPFSRAKYAEKQREYNIKFRNRTNYTPQLVVNGKEHFVGSSSSKMYDAISRYKDKKSMNLIGLTAMVVDKKKVAFSYEVQGGIAKKTIRTLLVLDERTTHVKRGENRNRTLQNSNIVVAEKSFLLEDSHGSMEISIPQIVSNTDKLNLIVLVENTSYDIAAAAKQALVRPL